MDIWQMRYFIQIYQEKSLSNAARKLYITQQALSKTLKKMEAELQIPLFNRLAYGLKPTIYADILYGNASRILDDYDQMMKELTSQKKLLYTTIKIGIANIFFPMI